MPSQSSDNYNLPPLVEGTINNAFISLTFQDSTDKKTANEIIAEYSKSYSFKTGFFQDRSCDLYIIPKTNAQSDIAFLEKKLNFYLIEDGSHVNLKSKEISQSIHAVIDGSTCDEVKNRLDAFNYELYDSYFTPIYSNIEVPNIKVKKELLKIMQRDSRFQKAEFDYPV